MRDHHPHPHPESHLQVVMSDLAMVRVMMSGAEGKVRVKMECWVQGSEEKSVGWVKRSGWGMENVWDDWEYERVGWFGWKNREGTASGSAVTLYQSQCTSDGSRKCTWRT